MRSASHALRLFAFVAFASTGLAQSPLYRIRGKPQFEQLGYSCGRADDVDADGRPDVVFGAPMATVDLSYQGRAIVISGRTGHQIFEFKGAGAGALLGRSVSRAGDVNHDGFSDLLLGAPGDDTGPLGC